MVDLCTLTGIMKRPDGTAFGDGTLVFSPEPRVVTVRGALVTAPVRKTVTTAADGTVSVALVPGAYAGTGHARGERFDFVADVPDQTSAPLADVIGVVAANAAQSALAKSMATTRDPIGSDDFAAGYRVFSIWTNTDTAALFICTRDTTAAAEWTQVLPGPRYVSGRYYGDIGRGTTGVAVKDYLFFRPFRARQRMTAAAVMVRMAGALGSSANSAMRAAIYAAADGRPIGAPLAFDNVGAAIGNAGAYEATTPVVLPPGDYWLAVKFIDQFDTGQALTAFQNLLMVDANDFSVAAEHGFTTLTTTASVGFRVATTWAAAFPTFAANFDWTSVSITTNSVPKMFVKAGG